jgi:hypothetical protein
MSIIELKTFEQMSPAEQREHLMDMLTDDGSKDVDLEELRKVFLKRHRQAKNAQRDYFTCKELGEMAGRSEDTIRRMFIRDSNVKVETHAGRNRKTYQTMLISRAAAKRRFPDLSL